MNSIHPTAIISSNAIIGEHVTIGAYSVIHDHVTLGNHVHIHSHVVVDGYTTIGDHTEIFPFTSIGSVPQDLKYHGEAGRLEIGTHNRIREHVTMNIGTSGGGMLTKIGDHNLLMVGVHIGHDSIVGNHTILVNHATLAGHVSVDDYAVLGGLCAVHQFCRIGKLAMIGGMTGVEHDVIPYGMAIGNRAYLKGLNLVGLERSGMAKETLNRVRHGYKYLFKSAEGSFEARLAQAKQEFSDCVPMMDMIDFLEAPSKRRFVMPEAS